MAVFNEPTQWTHPLGNNADVSTLPDDTPGTTGLASLQKLFQLINQTPLEAGGIAPEREDINALYKILGDYIYYTMNGGVPSYNNGYDYIPGRVVLYTDGNIYKCIQANGASSTVVAPDETSPNIGADYWKQLDADNNSTSLIPNQMIISSVPLTEANLHLLDGALLSGSGVYADYVDLMQALYESDPTLECFTDEATWQASVTAYGVCGKFVWDSVNDTLRLPLITGFIEGTNTASELGKLTEAGAPNITSNGIDPVPSISYVRGSYNRLYQCGALNFNYSSSDGAGGSGYGSVVTISLDASRSSSIYGNSNTIQPQSIKQYFYIVVGTVTKTQIQIDIDNYIADLALKADKNFSNIDNTAKIAIAHNAMPSGTYDNLTFGASGTSYTAPADGYVHVSGTTTTTSNQNFLDIRVTYPFAYSIRNVVAQDNYETSNLLPVSKGTQYSVYYNNVTNGKHYFIYAVGSESEQ